MKPEQLEDLLRYRIQQAHDTLEEAQILLDASAVRGTVNRAYYAMLARYWPSSLQSNWAHRDTAEP